ncbi:hypothetical protein BP6252_04132 [Coleophoma cylindrospora]|uniref:Uncharacterized protein n=1 Tax=Coleophoma cylindrospora TaxID=1849047 RepID=A0A3D8S070_9HELO|nr:hypothetical protein BP6252_04132 [Coleophoma cylindrospora]
MEDTKTSVSDEETTSEDDLNQLVRTDRLGLVLSIEDPREFTQIAHNMLYDVIFDLRAGSPTIFNEHDVFRHPQEYTLNSAVCTFTKKKFAYEPQIAHLVHWRSGLEFGAEVGVYTWKWILAKKTGDYWSFAAAAYIFLRGQEYCVRTNVPTPFVASGVPPHDPSWDDVRAALRTMVLSTVQHVVAQ